MVAPLCCFKICTDWVWWKVLPELAPRSIRVNCINPGMIETGLMKGSLLGCKGNENDVENIHETLWKTWRSCLCSCLSVIWCQPMGYWQQFVNGRYYTLLNTMKAYIRLSHITCLKGNNQWRFNKGISEWTADKILCKVELRKGT